MDSDRSQTPVSLPHMSMMAALALPSVNSEKKPSTGTKNGEEKREEWSARSIALFLDLYEEKYFDMDRGNFRQRDWEQLVDRFNQEGGGGKSVKQCRDKMDSLKKRHKLEKAKKASTGAETCTWIWFDKMDGMFGDNPKHLGMLAALEVADKFPGDKYPGDKFHVMDTENLLEEVEPPRIVGNWRQAKKVLKELPLSAEERGKARTLLLEKKEEDRLEYFEGDFEEITHGLKMLIERSCFNPSGSSGANQMDYVMASDMQRRLEELLTDVIVLKRRTSSDLRLTTITKRGRG